MIKLIWVITRFQEFYLRRCSSNIAKLGARVLQLVGRGVIHFFRIDLEFLYERIRGLGYHAGVAGVSSRDVADLRAGCKTCMCQLSTTQEVQGFKVNIWMHDSYINILGMRSVRIYSLEGSSSVVLSKSIFASKQTKYRSIFKIYKICAPLHLYKNQHFREINCQFVNICTTFLSAFISIN